MLMPKFPSKDALFTTPDIQKQIDSIEVLCVTLFAHTLIINKSFSH